LFMPRVVVEIDEKSYRILGNVRDYVKDVTGKRASIPELIEFHFAALFADDDLDSALAKIGKVG